MDLTRREFIKSSAAAATATAAGIQLPAGALAAAGGDTLHANYARALDGVGKIHFRFGRYEQAAAAFRRSLRAFLRGSS